MLESVVAEMNNQRREMDNLKRNAEYIIQQLQSGTGVEHQILHRLDLLLTKQVPGQPAPDQQAPGQPAPGQPAPGHLAPGHPAQWVLQPPYFSGPPTAAPPVTVTETQGLSPVAAPGNGQD